MTPKRLGSICLSIVFISTTLDDGVEESTRSRNKSLKVCFHERGRRVEGESCRDLQRCNDGFPKLKSKDLGAIKSIHGCRSDADCNCVVLLFGTKRAWIWWNNDAGLTLTLEGGSLQSRCERDIAAEF